MPILTDPATGMDAVKTAMTTAIRDAYSDLGKLGFMQACLVIALVVLATWLFYKIAHGFTGWMRFR